MKKSIYRFLQQYKHGAIVAIYAIIYLIFFSYLEERRAVSFHVLHTALDDMIPFCEYFIIPYYLWFLYVVAGISYFIFFSKIREDYYILATNLIFGMTVFLIVSYFYPNCQQLRPMVFERDNIFVSLVKSLYSTDTNTNVLPSIHVYNTIAVHLSISHCKELKANKKLQLASHSLAILIILSTMFLKQHTVIDVILGAIMSYSGYYLLSFYYHHDNRNQNVANSINQ